jgi:hypothetical protein
MPKEFRILETGSIDPNTIRTKDLDGTDGNRYAVQANDHQGIPGFYYWSSVSAAIFYDRYPEGKTEGDTVVKAVDYRGGLSGLDATMEDVRAAVASANEREVKKAELWGRPQIELVLGPQVIYDTRYPNMSIDLNDLGLWSAPVQS